MRFTLAIAVGNDSMKTPTDIAAALRKVATQIDGTSIQPRVGRAIIDANGNTVGRWEYTR